jgi:hypothetical protein
VLIGKHLRSAQGRLGKVRLTPRVRQELAALLREAIDHADQRLRESFRPSIATALNAGDLRPRNATERIARRKLIEELLDVIVHRGFLTMGGLRDAISRNEIKFDDLGSAPATAAPPSPAETNSAGRQPADRVAFSDPLLRINRSLGESLAGVYRRGEIYLRLFQRLSSVMFATPVGRLLTRFFILPFGGAFVVLEGLDHTLMLAIGKLVRHELHIKTPAAVMMLGIFFLGLLNSAEFRAAVVRLGRRLGHVFRRCVEIPRWLFTRPLVQAVVRSRAARLGWRYVIKPSVFAMVAWFLLRRGSNPRTRIFGPIAVFAFANLLLNSRLGRAIEETILDFLQMVWARLTGEIIAGLFRAVMHFFNRLLEALDRFLYQVDEWLRFRSGQGRKTLAAKAILGVIWFYLAYVTRFCINLLIEPQINPIKHFPVVTVSHKILLPNYLIIAKPLERLGLSAARAATFTFAIVTMIPGIFGFLAWELKSNWRLYRANRSVTLRPVQVGTHGETIARLLRPGLHSGTLPRLFSRLRHAVRHHRGDAAVQKQLSAIAHVRESVLHFLQREFIALLNQDPAWQERPLSVGEVKLSNTRIEAEIVCQNLSAVPIVVSFEQRAGWIVGAVDGADWLAGLQPMQFRRLAAALLGLYKMAGVDVSREQVRSAFAPRRMVFDFTRDALTAWSLGGFDAPSVYDLSDDPAQRSDESKKEFHLDARQVLLRYVSIDWETWDHVWETPDGGNGVSVAAAYATLPPRPAREYTSPKFSEGLIIGSLGSV